MVKPAPSNDSGSNPDQPGAADSVTPDTSAVQARVPLSMSVAPNVVHPSAPSQLSASSGQSADDFERLRARLGKPAENLDKRKVGFDGFRLRAHESKLERDRRYGSVYTITEFQNGYLVKLEMPRSIPRSSLGAAWGLTGAKPDYRFSITRRNDSLLISASLVDEKMRRVAYVSRSFPADFQTRIRLEAPISTLAHRLYDDTLEIVALKQSGSFADDPAADNSALRG